MNNKNVYNVGLSGAMVAQGKMFTPKISQLIQEPKELFEFPEIQKPKELILPTPTSDFCVINNMAFAMLQYMAESNPKPMIAFTSLECSTVPNIQDLVFELKRKEYCDYDLLEKRDNTLFKLKTSGKTPPFGRSQYSHDLIQSFNKKLR